MDKKDEVHILLEAMEKTTIAMNKTMESLILLREEFKEHLEQDLEMLGIIENMEKRINEIDNSGITTKTNN